MTAKGYYELIGESSGEKRKKVVLRFNIRAFRNSYGLVDLTRMRLVFHGILVGQTSENSLSLEAEISSSGQHAEPLTASDIISGNTAPTTDLLDVYDVILAGVEHVS
jgi:hypothetical protein